METKLKKFWQTGSAVRYMEGIADLMTNIADNIIFMVNGEVIRHQKND